MIKQKLTELERIKSPEKKAYYCVGADGQPIDKSNALIKEKLERRLSEGENIQIFEIAMTEDAPYAIG